MCLSEAKYLGKKRELPIRCWKVLLSMDDKLVSPFTNYEYHFGKMEENGIPVVDMVAMKSNGTNPENGRTVFLYQHEAFSSFYNDKWEEAYLKKEEEIREVNEAVDIGVSAGFFHTYEHKDSAEDFISEHPGHTFVIAECEIPPDCPCFSGLASQRVPSFASKSLIVKNLVI